MTHHQFDEKPPKPKLGKRVENQTDIRKRTNRKVAQRELFKAKVSIVIAIIDEE